MVFYIKKKKLLWKSLCMCAQLLNCVLLFVTPRTVAFQTLSVGFSRQEYWGGLPFPLPGDLPNPGIERASLYIFCIDRRVLYHCTTWEAQGKV